MHLRTELRRAQVGTACLWYLIILAALSACSPAVPLRPTTAIEVDVTATLPANATPLATRGAAPSSTAPESPPQTAATEAFAAAPTDRMAVVDQSTDIDPTHAGWWSIKKLGPVGQIFRPSFAGLDVVELWTEDQWDAACTGPGTTLQVHIHEATIEGLLLGSSAPVVLPDCYKGITFFSFPSLLTLTPDEVYVAEVVVMSGDNWGVVWQQIPDSYLPGQSIVRGTGGDADIWFQEGLRSSTPPTEAYCQNSLWQHVKRADGSAFKDQGDCVQYVNATQ